MSADRILLFALLSTTALLDVVAAVWLAGTCATTEHCAFALRNIAHHRFRIGESLVDVLLLAFLRCALCATIPLCCALRTPRLEVQPLFAPNLLMLWLYFPAARCSSRGCSDIYLELLTENKSFSRRRKC